MVQHANVLFTVKYLPDWCPGTNFKATARTMAKRLNLTAEVPYSFVKKQLKENKTHSVSFLSEAIKNIGLDSQLEHVHKWSAASMYLGGADTTVSALMTFFLAMMHYPEVQKKAQEELDRVIGNNRLPVGADKESLPYIDAIMKETHRWHPVAPMAIPHTTSTEQTVNGYRIPKGALLMPNTWYVFHQPPLFIPPYTHILTPSKVVHPRPLHLPISLNLQPIPLPRCRRPTRPAPLHLRLRPPRVPWPLRRRQRTVHHHRAGPLCLRHRQARGGRQGRGAQGGV